MSFILEALRKSEAERRRGQTPDLLSDALPVTPATRASTDNRGRIVAIVAISLIALLLVAWVLRPTTPIEREPAVAAPPALQPPIAHVAIPPLPTPPSLSPPPTRAAPSPTRQPPTSAPATTTAPSVASAQVPTLPSPTPTAEPRASTSEPHVAAPPSPATPEPAAAFASPDAPRKLADLSSDERQQLPALKVSMHMWAPDAAHRFAIIDGTRVNEGDRVGDAIVEAIQQDGVMLSWRGRHIRLPIR